MYVSVCGCMQKGYIITIRNEGGHFCLVQIGTNPVKTQISHFRRDLVWFLNLVAMCAKGQTQVLFLSAVGSNTCYEMNRSYNYINREPFLPFVIKRKHHFVFITFHFF